MRAVIGLTSALLYLAALLAAASVIPLRWDEILQLAAYHTGSPGGSWTGAMHWIAQTPGASPLNYLSQWPLVAFLGQTLLVTRAGSILSAIAASFLVWRIAKEIGLAAPLAAAAVFAFIPGQYIAATTAQPQEEALFFFLLAILFFLRLTNQPTIRTAIFYSLFLTAALYTQTFAFAPAVGYLLFFLRFVNRPRQRRAFWYLLPATAAPLLAYLPFYVWAAPQANPRWMTAPIRIAPLWQQMLWALSSRSILGSVVILLLSIAFIAALWISFRPSFSDRWSDVILRRNIVLFCLAGGAASVFVMAAITATVTGDPVYPSHVLPAVPELALLLVAAAGYFRFRTSKNIFAPILAALLVLASLVSDLAFIRTSHTPDVQAIADAVTPELTKDTCVVLVSEGLSRPIFLTLRPDLAQRECHQFFNPQVVLLLHPLVRPDQQENAESFFRGLNFVDVKRMRIGGGQVIVMRQSVTPK
jgi:4-amino-4-deoxy-L-arabinose transferase-like glycosyltransferase